MAASLLFRHPIWAQSRRSARAVPDPFWRQAVTKRSGFGLRGVRATLDQRAHRLHFPSCAFLLRPRQKIWLQHWCPTLRFERLLAAQTQTFSTRKKIVQAKTLTINKGSTCLPTGPKSVEKHQVFYVFCPQTCVSLRDFTFL